MCGEDAVLWVHARCVERCVAVEQLLERSARARWRDVRGFLGQFDNVEQVVLNASSAGEDNTCFAFHEALDERRMRCVINDIVCEGVQAAAWVEVDRNANA